MTLPDKSNQTRVFLKQNNQILEMNHNETVSTERVYCTGKCSYWHFPPLKLHAGLNRNTAHALCFRNQILYHHQQREVTPYL